MIRKPCRPIPQINSRRVTQTPAVCTSASSKYRRPSILMIVGNRWFGSAFHRNINRLMHVFSSGYATAEPRHSGDRARQAGKLGRTLSEFIQLQPSGGMQTIEVEYECRSLTQPLGSRIHPLKSTADGLIVGGSACRHAVRPFPPIVRLIELRLPTE